MKILKTKASSSSMVIAHDEYTQLTSGPMSVTVDRENGLFLSGPVSFTSGINDIKFGGIFKFNPLMMSGLPSTIMTPIPTLIFDLPSTAKRMVSAGLMSKMLSGIM